jgi:hypothetical protein
LGFIVISKECEVHYTGGHSRLIEYREKLFFLVFSRLVEYREKKTCLFWGI